MPQPGAILAGRYQAGRILGQGGMGVVIEATHLELGTRFAVKLLRDDLARSPDAVKRFLREARAAAHLRGENVCRVHDFGTLDDGVPFMVMELLAGCDFATLLDQLGPMTPELVTRYVLQVCTGIAEAHALGIVHRDLKPTNLFRTRRPDGGVLIKIVDFGLAKSLNGQDFSLTQTTQVMGSPRYMSPEQLKSSKSVDPRNDIWSLGVVMYELLTGMRPFDGETMTELALNITNDQPPPLPDTVPSELARTIMRCIEKDPAKRFQSIADLAAALELCVAEHPRDVAADDAATSVDTTLATMPGDSAGDHVGERDDARPKGHIRLVIVVSTILVAAIALYVALRRGDDNAAVTPAPTPATAPLHLAPAPPAAERQPALVPVDAATFVSPLDADTTTDDATEAKPKHAKPHVVPKHDRKRAPPPIDLSRSRY